MSNYHPEPYWSEVADRIKSRGGRNIIAGDDEPYYRYKRERFLSLLKEIDFEGKSVLEVGCGPGGNLKEVFSKKPSRLTGVDISKDMLQLSRALLPSEVELIKVDGTTLPFPDEAFDYVFTATVLQHNTDETMLLSLLDEICRVAKEKVILFERIEDTITGDELCLGRPVSYYENICKQNGFKLVEEKFINIRMSYFVSGAIRKGLNSKKRQEGEPLNKLSTWLQQGSLLITRPLDKVFRSRKDVAKLVFVRTKS